MFSEVSAWAMGAEVRSGRPAKTALAPTTSLQKAGDHDSNHEISGLPFLFRDCSARLVVDRTGQVLWLSEGAAALIPAESCITIRNGRLAGPTPHSERLLKELIADCASSHSPVEQLVRGAANEAPEIFVRAEPSTGNGSQLIALTIRRLQRKIDNLPDLVRLYGLTRTEQQIIWLMVQGNSVTEIAEDLSKSVLTVRTHIKHTYVKLGVGTKEQLFSTVMQLMVD